MTDGREPMPEKSDELRSKLSAWVPKEIHKQAKMLATSRGIDLQDLVTAALQDYLTCSGQGSAGAATSSNVESGSRNE